MYSLVVGCQCVLFRVQSITPSPERSADALSYDVHRRYCTMADQTVVTAFVGQSALSLVLSFVLSLFLCFFLCFVVGCPCCMLGLAVLYFILFCSLVGFSERYVSHSVVTVSNVPFPDFLPHPSPLPHTPFFRPPPLYIMLLPLPPP